MSHSLKDMLRPLLFFIEAAFWILIVATKGGSLLLWAAAAAALSGAIIIAAPSSWVTKPLAGASSLFGLTLAIYQAYMASTLLGTSLASLGAESVAAFVVFALVNLYLIAATISTASVVPPKA